MIFSYRTRRRLRRLGLTVLTLALIALVVWVCWLVWLGRFVVYTPEGVRLDFSVTTPPSTGEVPQPPAQQETVPILYDQLPEETTPQEPQVQPISGYYVDLEALQQDVSAVKAQLQQLPDGTAVLLDVKNTKGYFYYSSQVGTTTAADVNTEAMDDLISWLADSSLYAIARLPAFRDWEFGLNNVSYGLPKAGGNGSLWLDDTGCYWLSPTSEGALSYLERIVSELERLGFDEVVFTDFRFPNTDSISFDGDKTQAISDAAATLVRACASETFWVSFSGKDVTFPLPEGNSRLYLSNVEAAEAATVAGEVTTDDPANHVLFFTDVNDTRFDEYCVLRPLELAR